MSTKREREKIYVGASKAAKVIIGRLDRRFIKPATILVRITGWVLILIVAYISIFEDFAARERQSTYIWIGSYILYMVVLEIIKHLSSEFYELSGFRVTRIVVNLIMISALVSIAPTERHLLISAYAVPIVATIVYFADRNLTKVLVYVSCLLGIYAGSLIFDYSPELKLAHFLIYALVLAGVTIGFEMLRIRIDSTPGRLTELAKEWHKTLDLQRLLPDILANVIEVTIAQRGLIIIIDPRTKKYVGHSLYNFKLNANQSIENLARKCYVLVHGQPFESPDIIAAFNNNNIYAEFFDSPPRSIMAEPLYNRAGQVTGVINVAHNDPNRFDRISRNLLRELAFLMSNAIENCFVHRELKLREARSREAGEKFVSAGSEDEAANILIDEVRRQIPHAEKLTVHQFLPKTGELLPIHSYSLEETPNLYLWSGPKPRKLKPDLHLGYGIAGHALELRDTLLVPDVKMHPWFVELDHAQDIESLLVAPLFDHHRNELYGTISLESPKSSAFSLEDESTLTHLSTQASRAIARTRNFQSWREHGGILRQILEQIQAYDLSASEPEILQQVTDAATQFLGFKIARMRILDDKDKLVTRAVSGVSEETRKRLMEIDLPYSELMPFLKEDRGFRAGSSYLIKHGDPLWKRLVDKYFYISQKKMHNHQGWHAYDALITPLRDSSGGMLGILTLDLPNSGLEPDPQLLESIGVFASSAAWMIELSRFERRLRDQQYRTQSFIDTISRELSQGRDLRTICEVVVQVGAKFLSAEGCSLHFVRGKHLELTHSNYLADADYISRRKPISKHAKSGLTAWVAATGQVLRFNNEEYKQHVAWAGDDQHLQYLPSQSCRSVLLAPVKDSAGKVIAVLTLENKKTLAGPKDFDDDDQDRLVSLGNEFAKALEIIGFYHDIKEWERSGLADDLHDLINWYHSGVVMWIEALEVWLKQEDYFKAGELMPELRKHALTTIFELKELHTNLLKSSLEAGNFKKAIQETLSAWTNRVTTRYKETIQITLDCPEDIEVPSGLKSTIVRITSLAFSNALQHSGIIENPDIKIEVKVEQKNNCVTLAVIDNGKGIDFEKTPEGFGMGRMRQLADKINNWGDVKATLNIETEVNHGTKVFLNLVLSTDKGSA